ncbi:MAG: hypothetical protein JRM80_12265 [Nitrososphaerota archaeon]|nr:hypothetical protein [Nitrososphaerota archaeon]
MPVDWNAVLARPEVLSVLEKMLGKGVTVIGPTVDEKGSVSYSVGNGEPSPKIDVLESMVAAGIFEKQSEGRLLCCPQHEGAIDLSPLLRCPHCSSSQLNKGSLFQHNCGFIGAPELFSSGCPHCRKPSPPQTVKAVGAWYECQGCKKRSAQPNVFLFCKRFNHEFAIGLAKLIDQGSYNLTNEATLAMKGRLGIIISVLNRLRSSGAAVEVSGKMIGKSGVMHDFDLILSSQKGKVPIDVKVGESGPVDVVGVLSTYAKALDTNTNPTILVATPSATEDARRTASAYNMVLIEGSDGAAIAARILSAAGPLSAPGAGTPTGIGATSFAT